MSRVSSTNCSADQRPGSFQITFWFGSPCRLILRDQSSRWRAALPDESRGETCKEESLARSPRLAIVAATASDADMNSSTRLSLPVVCSRASRSAAPRVLLVSFFFLLLIPISSSYVFRIPSRPVFIATYLHPPAALGETASSGSASLSPTRLGFPHSLWPWVAALAYLGFLATS